MIKLTEIIKLNEDIWIKPDSVPHGIKNWVKEVSGKNLQRYKIVQDGEVTISMPWHEASRTIYQKFQLIGTSDAKPIGDSMSRSGMEADSPQDYKLGQRKEGTMEIPDGIVVVKYQSYPELVTIYTSKNAEQLLPSSPDDINLTMTEVFILAAAKQLKSFARPKFKEEYYNGLIEKGYLNKNKSITVDGRNILQNPKVVELLKQAIENYQKNTGRYSPVSNNMIKLKEFVLENIWTLERMIRFY